MRVNRVEIVEITKELVWSEEDVSTLKKTLERVAAPSEMDARGLHDTGDLVRYLNKIVKDFEDTE